MADVDAFRAELRTWLERHLPADLRAEEAAALPESERIRRLRDWQATLARDRWVAISWPAMWTGSEQSGAVTKKFFVGVRGTVSITNHYS